MNSVLNQQKNVNKLRLTFRVLISIPPFVNNKKMYTFGRNIVLGHFSHALSVAIGRLPSLSCGIL